MAKNIFNIKPQLDFEKRDLKKLTSDQDLEISLDELEELFPHNPLHKRGGRLLEPQIQVVHGSVEEINAKQQLFERGEKIDVDKTEQDGGEFHILNSEQSTLSSILNTYLKTNIFAKYARFFNKFDQLLNDLDSKLIIMTPLDSLITSLPLKPWEFPTPVTEADDEDEISNSNIELFIKSHIIDSSFDDLDLTKDVYLKTMNAVMLKLSKDINDNYKIVVEGYEELVINVIDVQIVDNGVLFVIDHVLEWPGM